MSLERDPDRIEPRLRSGAYEVPGYALALALHRKTPAPPPEKGHGAMTTTIVRPFVRVLRWDGIAKLTVDGEPWFSIECPTRQTLAASIFKIACPDEDLTDEDLEAFVAQILCGRDWRPFQMDTDAPMAWLRFWRVGRR